MYILYNNWHVMENFVIKNENNYYTIIFEFLIEI